MESKDHFSANYQEQDSEHSAHSILAAVGPIAGVLGRETYAMSYMK
jgi:hypothetical protein